MGEATGTTGSSSASGLTSSRRSLGGRDSHLRTWDLPGSLKPALHGTMRVWSSMLLPQAFLPASPAVDAESFTPRLTRTSVLYTYVIVKRFGLGSGFTRPLPQTRTRLSSRPLNGAGLPGSIDKRYNLLRPGVGWHRDGPRCHR